MNYGVILAAGKGTRVKSINVPKQYYEINGIPVIIYTLKRMLDINLFNYIYIAINKECVDKVKEYLDKFISREELDKIKIVYGGKERIDTIHNVIVEVEKETIGEDDVIVFHDAVRPFVTDKILKDSIDAAREFGACVAACPVSDTMLISSKGEYVEEIPDRSIFYKGQAPDSFKVKKFIELEKKLSDEQRKIIVGTSQICTFNNYPIRMIKGDDINFKITCDSDLKIAKDIIMTREKSDINETNR